MPKKKTPQPMTLLEAIEEQASEASVRSGRNRAIIKQHQDEIEEALERGYTWKMVYEALVRVKDVEMSYDTFRANCRAVGLERAQNSSHFRTPLKDKTPATRTKPPAKKKASKRS